MPRPEKSRLADLQHNPELAVATPVFTAPVPPALYADGWTLPQIAAMRFISAGYTHARTAQLCGVSQRALEQWLNAPRWQAAMQAERATYMEHVESALALSIDEAQATVIRYLQRDPDVDREHYDAAAFVLANTLWRVWAGRAIGQHGQPYQYRRDALRARDTIVAPGPTGD